MSVAIKDGSGANVNLASVADPNSNQIPIHSLDSAKATYRASASFTPQATSAVTVLSIKGSATKTVRVKKIRVGGVSTANASVIMQLIRSSALGSGGTTVSPTVGKMDSGNGTAATAVVSHYTTTLKAAGTSTDGPLSTHRLYTGVVTTPTLSQSMQDVFPENGNPAGQAIVLRGAADFLEYQLVGGGNLSAGTVLEYVVEWEEDAS